MRHAPSQHALGHLLHSQRDAFLPANLDTCGHTLLAGCGDAVLDVALGLESVLIRLEPGRGELGNLRLFEQALEDALFQGLGTAVDAGQVFEDVEPLVPYVLQPIGRLRETAYLYVSEKQLSVEGSACGRWRRRWSGP